MVLVLLLYIKMNIDKIIKNKKIKNKDSLIYNLIKKNGNGIVKSLNYYYSNGITDINQMIKIETEYNNKKTLKLSRNSNEIIKFKGKKCIIFNSDFMVCKDNLKENHEYGLRQLIKILKNNNWTVYVNKGKGDSLEYIEDINILIKYSNCNTPFSQRYFNINSIDLVFGGVQNQWVDKFINKYEIYKYNFPFTSKIPSIKLNDYIGEKQFEEYKSYIYKNKNDIEYDYFIIKPLFSYSGNGIFYLDINSNFDELNKQLNPKLFPYVLQPLIKNITRFNNKVNHIRIHILVSCFLTKNNDYIIDISLYDKYLILLAKDSKSFDSHGKSTDKYRTFQDYYTDYDTKLNLKSITKEIKEIVNTFEEIIRLNFKTINGDNFFIYNDRKSTFSLFAADLMITKEGHVKLIELNYKVGTKFWKENKKEMYDFFNWIYENGIKPME